MAVEYVPNVGPGSGVAQLLRSEAMQRFMSTVGAQTAQAARSISPTSGPIRTQTVMAFNRWCVNVINDAPDARWQEYGSRRQPPLHPLARGVLDALWSSDPNRRRGFSARLTQR